MPAFGPRWRKIVITHTHTHTQTHLNIQKLFNFIKGPDRGKLSFTCTQAWWPHPRHSRPRDDDTRLSTTTLIFFFRSPLFLILMPVEMLS